MAVYSGPKVVTDGMVLHLDKYNEESYLGEPTTNYFIGNSWNGDGVIKDLQIKDIQLLQILHYNIKDYLLFYGHLAPLVTVIWIVGRQIFQAKHLLNGLSLVILNGRMAPMLPV